MLKRDIIASLADLSVQSVEFEVNRSSAAERMLEAYRYTLQHFEHVVVVCEEDALVWLLKEVSALTLWSLNTETPSSSVAHADARDVAQKMQTSFEDGVSELPVHRKGSWSTCWAFYTTVIHQKVNIHNSTLFGCLKQNAKSLQRGCLSTHTF